MTDHIPLPIDDNKIIGAGLEDGELADLTAKGEKHFEAENVLAQEAQAQIAALDAYKATENADVLSLLSQIGVSTDKANFDVVRSFRKQMIIAGAMAPLYAAPPAAQPVAWREVLLEQAIRDSIESLERNSTSAPVVECLKAALDAQSESAEVRFHGAECPSYPDCTGGCGLGCTHEIERNRLARADIPDDQRATDDMTLAHNVRRATIEECAKIADYQAKIPSNTEVQRAHIYSAVCIAKAIRVIAAVHAESKKA